MGSLTTQVVKRRLWVTPPSAQLTPPAPTRQPASATLTARAIDVDRGDRTILGGISLTIGPQTRLGVVGPNGVGKSTLLRVLAGLEVYDRGQLELRPPSATVGYLAQQHDRSEETVRGLLHRRTGVAAADAELMAAASGLAGGDGAADARYGAALVSWAGRRAAEREA